MYNCSFVNYYLELRKIFQTPQVILVRTLQDAVCTMTYDYYNIIDSSWQCLLNHHNVHKHLFMAITINSHNSFDYIHLVPNSIRESNGLHALLCITWDNNNFMGKNWLWKTRKESSRMIKFCTQLIDRDDYGCIAQYKCMMNDLFTRYIACILEFWLYMYKKQLNKIKGWCRDGSAKKSINKICMDYNVSHSIYTSLRLLFLIIIIIIHFWFSIMLCKYFDIDGMHGCTMLIYMCP